MFQPLTRMFHKGTRTTPNLSLLTIDAEKRPRDTYTPSREPLNVSDMSMEQLQSYAVVVMYAKELFYDFTNFQRRQSGLIPEVRIEDTETYNALIQSPNGDVLWNNVKEHMTKLFNDIYKRDYSTQVSLATFHYFIVLFLSLKNIDSDLHDLFKKNNIELPTDRDTRRETIIRILRRPNFSSDDGAQSKWWKSEKIRGSDEILRDMDTPAWAPYINEALCRASELMDSAFSIFGRTITEPVKVYRAVRKDDPWGGVFYQTVNDTKIPKIDTWNRTLPSSVLSTSFDLRIALQFCRSDQNCVVYIFTLQPGLKVLPLTTFKSIEQWGQPLVQPEFDPHGEEEVLLPRGAVFTNIDDEPQRVNTKIRGQQISYFKFSMNVTSGEAEH